MYATIAATIMGVLMMFTGIATNRRATVSTIAVVLMAVLFGCTIYDLTQLPADGTIPFYEPEFLHGMARFTREGLWFNMLMAGCSLLYFLLSAREIRKVGFYVGEYFALVFFILVGIFMLSSFNNLLMLFLGIEIISIPQYVLAGSDKRNLKSSEASLKYFLMGAFSTGILLMGITLLYGATRTFNISDMHFAQMGGVNTLAIAGVLFIMTALGFKVSAAPMHLWTPDVYDGSPTAFTAYMATVVKASIFFAFIHLFRGTFGSISSHWMLILALITALTLLIGNVTAVFQQSVKRMLAYSSIAQAGFMLFAVLANNTESVNAIMIYAVAYSVATLGLFAVLMKMKDFTYDGFNGLGKSHPLLALVTTVFLLSLAGIPLTGGFMAKYFAVRAVMMQGSLFWLVIFALLMAAISAYYYFRVIIAMYFKTGQPELHTEVDLRDKILLAATTGLVILLGVVPQLFLIH